MYEKELENIGLTEKETKVYLSSLESGPETVQNLAQSSGINRATTYVQIKSLKEKGLMSEFQKGKKTFFVAENPGQLKNLLRVFEKELSIRQGEVESILPGLMSLYDGMGERPRVRFFEGQEGSAAIREDVFKVKDKHIEAFMNFDKLAELFAGGKTDENTRNRVAKGINSKVLYVRSEGPLPNLHDPAQLREAKYLAKPRFNFSADITIYDSKVALVTYGDHPTGVIIENKEMAETLRTIFYLLWDNL